MPVKTSAVAVVEVLMVPEEIVDDKFLLLDVGCGARAAAPHLLVEDGAAHPPAEHQMQHLSTVEASVKHTNAHRDHGIGLGLKLPNQGIRVGHVRSDNLGVAPLIFGVQLVQILRQSCRVVLSDGKDNRLAGTWVLARSEFVVALPSEVGRTLPS